MQLTPDIEAYLAERRPDLLRELRSTVQAANAGPKGVHVPLTIKVLSAAEQSELDRLAIEKDNPPTSAERRGGLVKATLKLRGLGDLFSAVAAPQK